MSALEEPRTELHLSQGFGRSALGARGKEKILGEKSVEAERLSRAEAGERFGGEERVSNGPYIRILGRRVPMPRSRIARIPIGASLIVLGIFGFLPVLGFWMIPAGFLVLSYDVAMVRRWRRKLALRWERRRRPKGAGR